MVRGDGHVSFGVRGPAHSGKLWDNRSGFGNNGLSWKDLIKQDTADFGVAVGTAVPDDDESGNLHPLRGAMSRPPHHHTACRDAGEQ
jgi:hypothetical protein